MAARYLPRAFLDHDGTPKYHSIILGYCDTCGCNTCVCDVDPLEISNEHPSSSGPSSSNVTNQAMTPVCSNITTSASQDDRRGLDKPNSSFKKRPATPDGWATPMSRVKFSPPTCGPAIHYWLKKRMYRDRRGALLDRNGLTLATEALGYVNWADGILLHL